MSGPKLLGIKYKQPLEVVPAGRWGIAFSPDCDAGETIASAVITVTVAAGDTTPLVAGSPVTNGTSVTASFTGGTDRTDYHVQVLATGTSGAVYDADFLVQVREV